MGASVSRSTWGSPGPVCPSWSLWCGGSALAWAPSRSGRGGRQAAERLQRAPAQLSFIRSIFHSSNKAKHPAVYNRSLKSDTKKI